MNFYTHLLGDSSLNMDIPFFQIVKLTDNDIARLNEPDVRLCYILTNQSKGYAMVTGTSVERNSTGRNEFSIQWEFTYDFNKATRFVTSEAARYFSKIYGCGVTASQGWSWFHTDHAKTVRFMECYTQSDRA